MSVGAIPRLPIATMHIGDEARVGTAGFQRHRDPSTGRLLGEIGLGSAADVDDAVAAARIGAAAWRQVSPAGRREVLMRFARLLEENGEQMAEYAALETGTPCAAFRRGHVALGAAWTRYYASQAEALEGRVVSSESAPGFVYSVPEPFGVIGVIIPWNAPLTSLSMKVPAALAAGNAVIVKPPEFTPFVAMRYVRLAREAGLPEGAINLVLGGPDVGAALAGHPGVGKLSFTGSSATGRQIMRACAETLKPMVLQLSGKSANLIFDDADIDAAALFAARMVAANSGQSCSCPSRLLVDNRIKQRVIDTIAAAMAAIKVGLPQAADTACGPIVHEAALTRILGMIDGARDHARLVTGGERLDGALRDGYFLQPTLFDAVDPGSRIAREEIFGPVLCVFGFDTEEEAIALANDSDYALAGYIHSRDAHRVRRVSRQLQAGAIMVNGASAAGNPAFPFGGMQQSGFGREGGRQGLEEFVQWKSVTGA